MIPLNPTRPEPPPPAGRCPETQADLSSSGETWDELYHQLLVEATNERTRRTWRLGATIDSLADLEL